MPASDFRSIVEDREGHLWLGTAYKGYFMLLKTNHTFSFVQKQPAHQETRSIYEDSRHGIWTGARGGLAHCVPRLKAYWNGQYDRIMVDTHRDERIFQPQRFCHYITRTSLVMRRQGNAWWKEKPPGVWSPVSWPELIREDPVGWTKDFPRGELSSYDVRAIVEDRSGARWFGTANGLNRLAGRQFTAFTTEDGLAGNDIRSLFEDVGGTLWIGTDKGLSRMNPVGTDSTPSLISSGNRTRWNASLPGDGRQRPATKLRFSSFTTRDGLFDDHINAIIEDGLGYLWLICYRGIYRVRKQALHDLAEGWRASVRSIRLWRSRRHAQRANAQSLPAQRLQNARRQTLVRHRPRPCGHPSRRRQRKPLAPSRHHRRTPHRPLPLPTTPAHSATLESEIKNQTSKITSQFAITLPPGSGRLLEIQYTATSLSAPERVQFKYRLADHDPAWIVAGARRTAYYSNLRPGQYHFEVMACNNHNVWNETPATLAFTLAPFYYETWWFRSGGILAFAGLIAGGVWLRLRTLRRIHELEKQVALTQERRRIARDLHDHIGSQLTRLVVGGGARKREAASAIPGGDHESYVLARQALDGLGEVVWLTDPGKDTLRHTVEYLCRYTRHVLASTPIQLRLDIPVEIPAVPLSAATRHHLLRVFEEALTNALKHAQATQIQFGLRLADGTFALFLEDNGCGFSTQNSSDLGNGLTNMRERLAETGGRFEIASEPGRGTRITTELPLLQ